MILIFNSSMVVKKRSDLEEDLNASPTPSICLIFNALGIHFIFEIEELDSKVLPITAMNCREIKVQSKFLKNTIYI